MEVGQFPSWQGGSRLRRLSASGPVSLYFEHGNLLEHGDGLLLGDGLKRGRYLRLYPGDEVPVDRVGILISEAIALFA
jgi:hypothetical protein